MKLAEGLSQAEIQAKWEWPKGFWERVKSADAHECWEWTGGTVRGYGNCAPYHGVTRSHRVVAMVISGRALDSKEFVCHHCDNPRCLNPAHLYIGDAKSNMADAVSRKRIKGMEKTHCPHGHPFTPENTIVRDGRNCRTCKNIYRRQWYVRKKAEKLQAQGGHPGC